MVDKLKEYVEEHREDLEVFPFDVEAGWGEISGQVRVPEQRVRRFRPWMAVAASVSLLIVGALIGVRFYAVTGAMVASSEFADMQYYYQEMVEAKLSLVRQQVDDPEILEDLQAMDLAFAELQEDLQDNVDNEEVLEAMIDNYRLKLQILERILNELEEDNHEQQTDI